MTPTTVTNQRLGVLIIAGTVALLLSFSMADGISFSLQVIAVVAWAYAGTLWGQRHRRGKQ